MAAKGESVGWDKLGVGGLICAHYHMHTYTLLLLLRHYSHVQLCATLWIVAHQAPLSMEFSRQEYWSGLPFPSPGDLPHPGIEPRSPALKADSLPSELPGKSQYIYIYTGTSSTPRMEKPGGLQSILLPYKIDNK